MSRIGNKIITLPEGVTVTVNPGVVNVKGKLGETNVPFDSKVLSIELDGNVLTVKRNNEEKHTKQLHGTTRALINNAVIGNSEGFTKKLEIVGIGYRAEMKGDKLEMHLGYSHLVTISPLPGVKITCKDANNIEVSGNDKFAVGQVASLIHDSRKPEPYGGKGVKYVGEFILRKEGKRAGK